MAEQARECYPEDITDNDQFYTPAQPFLYPRILQERRLIPHQKKDEDQAAGKKEDRGRHAPQEGPGTENGVAQVAKGGAQQGIYEMALQHHQDGVGAQQVDKRDAPVGERSRKRFDGCMFFIKSLIHTTG